MRSALSSLPQYNQQVLQCQDEAYTLAWYLLGDDRAAESAVEAAVLQASQALKGGAASCRLAILRSVLQQCQQRHSSPSLPMALPVTGDADRHDILAMLCRLPLEGRQALILVDILGLDYPEAAWLLGLPVKRLGQRLAQARLVITC